MYILFLAYRISDTFLNKEKIFGYSGINYGLNIEINNDINDYFYTEHASLGANVKEKILQKLFFF